MISSYILKTSTRASGARAALRTPGAGAGTGGRRPGGSARRGVKVLVDAQLSARLARFLADAGHDVVHTSELPDGNRTTNARIAEVGDSEGRVVVTTDHDFRYGHLLADSPRRLVVVETGNITDAGGGAATRCGSASFIEVNYPPTLRQSLIPSRTSVPERHRQE